MVKKMVEDCEYCARFNRAHPRDPPVEPDIDVEELDPMECIGVDIFYYQSKYYLVVACLATGFTFVEFLGKSTTCKETTEKLKRMFESYGFPSTIRYDGGPHFRGEFKEMLKEYAIPETPASPYNHASNGLTERHVGCAKLLLKKCTASRTDFRSALSALNNTACADRYSAADLFYRRRLRSTLLELHRDVDFVEGQKSHSRAHWT